MAATLVQDCPHCATKNSGMTYLAYRLVEEGRYTAVFFCNNCLHLTCVEYVTNDNNWLTSSAGNFHEAGKRNQLRVVRTYPEAPPSRAPDAVSPGVQRTFVQAEEAKLRRHHDAAASMYRKAIDLATRELDSSLAGKNLAPRIDALHSAGKLTDDLKTWAHLIRLDGNQGAHDDEELTDEEIAQLASFTELFLTYTFTLPAQVRARTAAAQAAGAVPNP